MNFVRILFAGTAIFDSQIENVIMTLILFPYSLFAGIKGDLRVQWVDIIFRLLFYYSPRLNPLSRALHIY